MGDKKKSSEKDSALNETPKGENYRAVIDTEKCTVSGGCFKGCEVDAIKEGPRRMQGLIACACAGIWYLESRITYPVSRIAYLESRMEQGPLACASCSY